MIESTRRSYFRLLDEAVSVSGNSKAWLHEYYKDIIWDFLKENPDNFNVLSDDKSTKNLSYKGWIDFYNEFRHFCINNFNI